MRTNRRIFLKTTGFSVIGLVAATGLPKQIFGADQEFVLQNPVSFRNLIGTNFTLYKNDSAIEAVLSDVKVFTPKKSAAVARTPKTASFRLIFRVPEAESEQNIYQVFHPSIGLFNLMLVPGSTENNQPTLSAVINKLA
ncbi:MAG: hypothetical protein LUM44_13245 [Pyrinomonadaceae bacterium]|nr:hypothetical protein [Pyrinomonadaceae bacterium]